MLRPPGLRRVFDNDAAGMVFGVLVGVTCASTLLWLAVSFTSQPQGVSLRSLALRSNFNDTLPIGHIPLDNVQEAEFVGKIAIGTPPRYVSAMTGMINEASSCGLIGLCRLLIMVWRMHGCFLLNDGD